MNVKAKQVEEFKFPDELNEEVEIDVSAEGDIEIEVLDDTPVEDRGRKPLEKEVDDPSDEEVGQYSDKVQKRIKELAHARHDERRAKEAALREREEAVRVAQKLVDDNKRLREYVAAGEQSYAEMLKAKAEADIANARRTFKEAQESYDTDAIISAQEQLTDARMRLAQANNFRPSALQHDNAEVYNVPVQQPVDRPNEKTLRWQAKNQWFGAQGYEEMTAMALALHTKLTNENGPEYARTDEYFERIDARLHSKFPEVFGTEEAPRKSSTRKPATVVASGTRSGTVRKIKLTKTQEGLAHRLGLTPEQYAREVMKMEK